MYSIKVCTYYCTYVRTYVHVHLRTYVCTCISTLASSVVVENHSHVLFPLCSIALKSKDPFCMFATSVSVCVCVCVCARMCILCSFGVCMFKQLFTCCTYVRTYISLALNSILQSQFTQYMRLYIYTVLAYVHTYIHNMYVCTVCIGTRNVCMLCVAMSSVYVTRNPCTVLCVRL